MSMKGGAFPLLAILFAQVCAANLFAAPQIPKRPHDAAELQAILEKCGGYCEELENAVLDVGCREKVVEETFEPQNIVDDPRGFQSYVRYTHDRTREFVYDYQLVRNADKTKESRTLLKENGEARQEKGAELKTMGHYEFIVFSPVALLGKSWQAKYDYHIVGEKKIRGRQAIAISATPKPGEWTGNLYGTIWVGEDDYSILKIERSPDSVQNIGSAHQSAWELKLKVEVVLTADYGFENNGIRFPSEFSIHETRSYAQGSKVPSYTLDVDYSAYRFVTVETEVKD